ncbi:MAG: hypothetical protein SFV19_07510 [Rhodospirillaceae bacterium]|nr:hypothetical protein [Rhodospirillaceae bacterium]
MAIKQRLKSLVDKLAVSAPSSPWRPATGPYPALATLDPAALQVDKVAGVLAVWHLGVRPQWLKVAACADLGAVVRAAMATPAIMSYAANGGIYAAWAPLPPAFLAGPVVYLVSELKPALQAVTLEGELVPKKGIKPEAIALPPGTEERREQCQIR